MLKKVHRMAKAMCTVKTLKHGNVFETREEAEADARLRNETEDGIFHAYRCHRCNKYHSGRDDGRKHRRK